jgi:hypothetical protein
MTAKPDGSTPGDRDPDQPAWLEGIELPLTVPNPVNLKLAEGMGIKAATGVDVASPDESTYEIGAALAWFELNRRRGRSVTIEEILEALEAADLMVADPLFRPPPPSSSRASRRRSGSPRPRSQRAPTSSSTS